MELCKHLFLFTLLNLIRINYPCIYNCCNCGEVSPVNVYTTKGSTLVLNCTIEEDSSPYTLMFTKNNVEQSDFTEQEENIILLKKVVMSFDDQGVYSCYKNDKKVGSSFVEVEYPLQRVNDSDFRCMLYDWDHSLSCVWEIGNYKKEGNIEVKVIAETMNHRELTPDKINNTYCQWKKMFDDSYWYRFYLTVNNTKMNQSIQSIFTRAARSMVKPAPISEVFVEIVSSTCLTVRWNTTKFKYQLLVFIASDEWNSSVQKKEARPKDHVEQYLQFCNLIPFTHYTFNITRRKLTMIGVDKYREDGYWSDPAFFTFKTMADVPASPPNITEGSFYHMYGNETILYWKPIKPIDRHGIIITYIVSYVSSDGRDNYSLSREYENVTLTLHEDKWYNVCITAVTQEGHRSPSACVLIPPKLSIPTPSTVVIELDKNRSSASIRWKGSELCQEYVVFWMAGKNLDWIISPHNSTILTASVHNLEKVGVSCSANVSNRSSENPGIVGGGLHWFRCKYFDEKAPALPVAVTVIPYEEALDLSWLIQCNEQSSYPQWINVTWCDLDFMLGNCQVWSHELLEPSERNYRIEGLDPRKTYRVKFISVSKDGRIKESNDFHDEKPVPKTHRIDFVDNPKIIWTIAGLLVVLVVITVSFYALRKCRVQPAIEVPDVTKMDERGSGYTNDTLQYTDKGDDKEYKVLNDPILMNDFEGEKEIFYSSYNGHIATDEENITEDPEVPDILEDMEKSELHKKQKSTSQSSDYSKFITASGHTNNSEAFNQSRSQLDSHCNQSKPQSVLLSIDLSQSKPQNVLSNHSGSSNHNQSKLLSGGTGSGINEEAWLDESSTFSSNLEDDYRQIRQDSMATDASSYLYSKSMSTSSHNTNPNVDSYSKVDVNEDINAETDDELLVNLQSSPNSEQNNSSTGSNERSDPTSHQTSAISLQSEAQQAPASTSDLLTSSLGELQNLHDSTPHMNKTVVSSPQEEPKEEIFSSNSGASLTSSTSDDDGYKTVNLNSGCTSSVQSSTYTPS